MGRVSRLELGGSSRKLLTKDRLRKAREALRCAVARLRYTTVGNIHIYIYTLDIYIFFHRRKRGLAMRQGSLRPVPTIGHTLISALHHSERE